ncbi:hypothetical protein GW756_00450 [bacterium]|nr:hypothetical protein [bacterium]NCQ54828.1 hypothetical protein [Candidatus Parcubacteria bacterium]NCS66872.1 hypothetical protein [Candidatus Peregrinibacteria bacterium]NCS95818.1 hypothetical protein [bacterium]
MNGEKGFMEKGLADLLGFILPEENKEAKVNLIAEVVRACQEVIEQSDKDICVITRGGSTQTLLKFSKINTL